MQLKAIKCKNNTILENGRQSQFILKEEDDLMFLKMETTSKKIMQPSTIKSKDNGCGTAPGNLVFIYFPVIC